MDIIPVSSPNSCLSGKTALPGKQNYSIKSLLFLRHPQTFTSLLTLGQRGDFGSQRVDILLVPDGEGVPRQGDAAALVIGAVIGRVAANDRTLLGLAGQGAGSIADTTPD